MTIKETIKKADRLRPNAINDEQKADWVWSLETDIADLIGADMKANPFPADVDLTMPAPYDGIYSLYLMAMIDNYNQDSTLYANDMTMFNEAYGEARRWWRRHHLPFENKNWKV